MTLRRWATQARRRLRVQGRIAVTIVTPSISRQWNTRYRRRGHATNVLSFDYAHDAPVDSAGALEGEVLLCPNVIRRESRQLQEPYRARLKMLLEHGLIHLLGLDHATAREQRRWSRIERKLS